jgi:hypothetical protein
MGSSLKLRKIVSHLQYTSFSPLMTHSQYGIEGSPDRTSTTQTSPNHERACHKQECSDLSWEPEEFWQEFQIPDSSGEFSRNDVHAGICRKAHSACMHVIYLVGFEWLLSVERAIVSRAPEFRRNSGILANSIPAHLWRCPGI